MTLESKSNLYLQNSWGKAQKTFSDLQLSYLQHAIRESQDSSQRADIMECASLVYLVSTATTWLQAKVWTERSFRVREPHLYFSPTPPLHLCGAFPWAKGKKGFKPTQCDHWSFDSLL